MMDTRPGQGFAGNFGQPAIRAGQTRTIKPALSGCGLPSDAKAWAVNLTLCPPAWTLACNPPAVGGNYAAIDRVSLTPSGYAKLGTSTLYNPNNRIRAVGSIVPAGLDGPDSAIDVSVFGADTDASTHIIIDVNGYFVPNSSSALEYFPLSPLSPCRLVDTRLTNGSLGGPILSANTTRTFPMSSSPCLAAAQSAQAYALNITVVPNGPLGFVTVWPTGQSQPVVSHMNSLEGWVLANGAVVKAGTSGSLNVYATDSTHIVIDVTGYFGPSAPSGNVFTTVNPCRAINNEPFNLLVDGQLMPKQRDFGIPGDCTGPGLNVTALAANFTIKPTQSIGFLTVWPTGLPLPLASLLNAVQGEVVGNIGIIPAGAVNLNQENKITAEINAGSGYLHADVAGYFVKGTSGGGGQASSMAPSLLEVNLSAIPLDDYDTEPQSGLESCPSRNWTVRDCVRYAFSNVDFLRSGSTTEFIKKSPHNYMSQGVKGVRFFYSLGGGGGTTAFNQDGTVNQNFKNNLAIFLADLKSFGVMTVTPTAVLGDWSGLNTTSTGSCRAGKPCFPLLNLLVTNCSGVQRNLLFYPWMPFGWRENRYPDMQGDNAAHTCSPENPEFWGWAPFLDVVDAVLGAIKTAQLTVADYDVENELNLNQFTVQARFLYDPKHGLLKGQTGGFDVLGAIRQKMQSRDFDAEKVTASAPYVATNMAGFSCASVYGDGASLIHASAVYAATTGQLFGQAVATSPQYGLECGGTSTTMITLGMAYSTPSALNIHNHICLEGTGSGSGQGCNINLDVTSTAQVFYNSVFSFLQIRGLSNTGTRVIFGETNSNQNCDLRTKAMARQNGNGLRQSTLWSSIPSAVALRPWNHFGQCFSVPTLFADAYRP
jgi:hypothetical protein